MAELNGEKSAIDEVIDLFTDSDSDDNVPGPSSSITANGHAGEPEQQSAEGLADRQPLTDAKRKKLKKGIRQSKRELDEFRNAIAMYGEDEVDFTSKEAVYKIKNMEKLQKKAMKMDVNIKKAENLLKNDDSPSFCASVSVLLQQQPSGGSAYDIPVVFAELPDYPDLNKQVQLAVNSKCAKCTSGRRICIHSIPTFSDTRELVNKFADTHKFLNLSEEKLTDLAVQINEWIVKKFKVRRQADLRQAHRDLLDASKEDTDEAPKAVRDRLATAGPEFFADVPDPGPDEPVRVDDMDERIARLMAEGKRLEDKAEGEDIGDVAPAAEDGSGEENSEATDGSAEEEVEQEDAREEVSAAASEPVAQKKPRLE